MGTAQFPVRISAWLLGSFLISAGFWDVVGLMPYSEETPPWPSRLASQLPSMLAGIVLLSPMDKFHKGHRYALLATAYLIVVSWMAFWAAQGIYTYLYFPGYHWMVVPTSLAVLTVPVANGILLWCIHRKLSTTSAAAPQ